jgi:hypothetical protein
MTKLEHTYDKKCPRNTKFLIQNISTDDILSWFYAYLDQVLWATKKGRQ